MEQKRIVEEAVETCPYCGEENVYNNIDVVGQDYVAQCKNCHQDIMLCDECLNAEDNPGQRCDWSPKNGCFRHPLVKDECKTYYVVINEQLSKIVAIKANTADEAVDQVEQAYENGDITLDSSDYVAGSTEIYDATNEMV